MTRIKIINWVIVFAFSFLFLTLLRFQIIKGREFKKLSDKNCIRLFSQEGSRGDILDTNGNLMVGSQISYDVMLLPQRRQEDDKILMKVASVLGIDFKELKERFNSGFAGFSMPVIVARDIDIKKAIILGELKSDFGNIIIQPHPLRYYPYGRLACHVIGYLNEIDRWRLTKLADYGYKTKDIVGFSGVEEKYDYYLRQEEGGLSMEVDHKGKLVQVMGFRPPRNGKNMQLTLNLKIQKIAEDKISGRIGCVVIMDPYSGEMIAMANYPNFSPSVFINKTNPSIQGIFNDPNAPLINRSISSSYAAGSVFKLIVATAALQLRRINLSTSFLCSGVLAVGNRNFSCWDTHGQQDLLGAITRSCNTFFYKTGILLGPWAIHDYAIKFGLGKITSIDLPYENSGFVPSPLWAKIYKLKKWFDGDTANFAIGQGDLLVTPLQITRMMAVFANGGYLVTPYVVKGIDGQGISNSKKETHNLSIKDSNMDYLRRGLRSVVSNSDGTANVLSGLSVSVAGKTGTAQAPPGNPHAWFAGFFPFKNPKFVICVFLEHGGHGYVSCVVAKQIIEEMIKEGLI